MITKDIDNGYIETLNHNPKEWILSADKYNNDGNSPIVLSWTGTPIDLERITIFKSTSKNNNEWVANVYKPLNNFVIEGGITKDTSYRLAGGMQWNYGTNSVKINKVDYLEQETNEPTTIEKPITTISQEIKDNLENYKIRNLAFYYTLPGGVPTHDPTANANIQINEGDSVVLTWNTAYETNIRINNTPVENNGSITVKPTKTTTYILEGTNIKGEIDREQITINVESLDYLNKKLDVTYENMSDPNGSPKLITGNGAEIIVELGDSITIRWSALNISELNIIEDKIARPINNADYYTFKALQPTNIEIRGINTKGETESKILNIKLERISTEEPTIPPLGEGNSGIDIGNIDNIQPPPEINTDIIENKLNNIINQQGQSVSQIEGSYTTQPFIEREKTTKEKEEEINRFEDNTKQTIEQLTNYRDNILNPKLLELTNILNNVAGTYQESVVKGYVSTIQNYIDNTNNKLVILNRMLTQDIPNARTNLDYMNKKTQYNIISAQNRIKFNREEALQKEGTITNTQIQVNKPLSFNKINYRWTDGTIHYTPENNENNKTTPFKSLT